jgi:pseudaminic acid biosynthesis-associated methylase
VRGKLTHHLEEIPMNEQETFWQREYAAAYREKNADHDLELGVRGWREMLRRAGELESILECGSNIGRNIRALQVLLPQARKSIIELSPEAYQIVLSRYPIDQSFNGTIVASNLPSDHFDLVFTCGVLIHIHPDQLLANMRKMFDYSRRFILIAEYFSRTPASVEYQGRSDTLFKCDFGKLFAENFEVEIVDYGFLWGHVYDRAGFDDITWWMFRKKERSADR